MLLIDSHCHLNKLNYQTLHRDVNDVIKKAHLRSVKIILSVCTTLSDFYIIKKMTDLNKNILLSCGIHPLNIDNLYDLNELQILATSKEVIAIGETGLDYHYQKNNKLKQQDIFREHIRIGKKQNKPIIVHTRNAINDTLNILTDEKAEEIGGILHCFNENRNFAKKILDLGFYISICGTITFRNAEVIRDTALYVPLERLLLETDSPYLSPVPYRGKENQPAYLRNIAEYLAILKGVSLEKIAIVTTKNFSRLFNIDIKHLS